MQTPETHARSTLRARRASKPVSTRLFTLLAAPGIVALILDPARWLWRSWHDPSYQSDGMLVAALTAGLIVVSVASGSATPDPRAQQRAWGLLAITAAMRLLGRLLAVNTIGAIALVVDVAAVAILLGVARRPFALAPAVLACFSALALPVEHLTQRLLGHPLQLLAAAASERILTPFFPELTREGVLLLHPAVELAIDLPCSGARGLTLFAAIALGVWTRRKPGLPTLATAGIAVVFGAFAANTLRIVGIFVGEVAGIPIIEEPWHSLLGALALGLAALPLIVIASRAPTRHPSRPLMKARLGLHGAGVAPLRWPIAVAISALGIAIAAAPKHPVDVSTPVADRHLPMTLGRFVGAEIPLRRLERRYYDTWGGFAQKRVYNDGNGLPHTALLVRTRSPLRHLHGPDRCLLGAGHEVTRLGVAPGVTPSVVYRSVAPDGAAWRVEASFVSDSGRVASSVSEVVWRWLDEPNTAWSLIERISPWTSCEIEPGRCRDFENALFASLDLPVRLEP